MEAAADGADGADLEPTENAAPAAAAEGAAPASGTTDATDATDRRAMLQQREAELQQMKVCVFGFGKFTDKKKVKAWLNARGLKCANVKKARGQPLAFVGFVCAEDRAAAAAQLPGMSFKEGGAKLQVTEARPRQFREPQKRQLHYIGEASGDAKRQDIEGEDGHGAAADDTSGVAGGGRCGGNNGEGGGGAAAGAVEPNTIQDQVTPLAGIPYAEQLANKQAAGQVNVVRMIRRIRKKYVQLHNKLSNGGGRGHGRGRGGRGGGRGGGGSVGHRGGDDGVEATSEFDLHWAFCGDGGVPVDPIIHAPAALSDGYRNKCSFTIGRNAAGAADVGFRMGGFNSDVGARVVDPAGCKNVSALDQHCLAVVREYLSCGPERGGTALQVFDIASKVRRAVVCVRARARGVFLLVNMCVCACARACAH
jgi:tRNA (uracil-5-)-methyltransferase